MMLKIRKEQMEVFEQAAIRNFEDEMVRHMKKFSLLHCKVIEDNGVREVIRLGIDRSEKYSLTNRGPVRFYIELMFMFGSDFDTDPQYPWAGEILNDPRIVDQMQRADCLYNKAMDCVDTVAGPDYEYEKEALRRISHIRFENLPAIGDNVETEIVIHLNRIHPQKCKYIGQPAFQALIQRGNALTESYALPMPDGIALLVGLMFAFGHGCVNDPQFPWIAETLNNTQIVAPSKRIERLYSKMVTYLSYELTN